MAARLKAKRPNNWVQMSEYLVAIQRAETAERERDAERARAEAAYASYVRLMRDVANERNAHAARVAALEGGRHFRPDALDALEFFRQRLHQALGEHAPTGDRYSTLELIWAVERVVERMGALRAWVDAEICHSPWCAIILGYGPCDCGVTGLCDLLDGVLGNLPEQQPERVVSREPNDE